MATDNPNQWKTLDKDLNRISQVEYATQYLSRSTVGIGVALAFMVVAGIAAAVFAGVGHDGVILVAAAVLAVLFPMYQYVFMCVACALFAPYVVWLWARAGRKKLAE